MFKYLQSPMRPFGFISLIVGIFLMLLGVVLYAAIGGEDGSITLLVMLLNGGPWFIAGLILLGIVRARTRKLERLKGEGLSYDVEITNVVPSMSVRMGNMPVIYVEGIYVNREGSRCKVRSRLFLWRSLGAEGLGATVHVDSQDPSRYAFELTETARNENRVDIDYT